MIPVSQPSAEPSVLAVEARVGAGRVEEHDGFRTLYLEGSPYEMGFQHGVLLGDEIKARIRDHLLSGLVGDASISHFLLLRHAREVEGWLSAEHREEMAGIADGAGVSYSQVLLLNTYDDLFAQPWPDHNIRDLLFSISSPFTPHQRTGVAVQGADPSGEEKPAQDGPRSNASGAFAVFGAATRDGNLLQAVSFSSPSMSPEELLVIVCRPEKGNSFLAVGQPGSVGFDVGMNEEELSVTALPSRSQDASLAGVPLPFLLRDVLQQAGDIPSALRILASADRTTGHNVLVGDGQRPDARVMEYSTHLHAVFEAQGDLVVRTNHFLDGDLREAQETLSGWDEASSWERLDSLQRAMESDYGRLDPSRVIGIILELSATGDGSESIEEGSSILGVLLVVSDLELRIVTGSGSGGRSDFVIRLDESL
jgi:hypothetical protein